MAIAYHNYLLVRELPIEQETWQGLSLLSEALFCGEGCEESYWEDRRLCLIYGAALMEFESGNKRVVGHHDAARWTHRCPYCGAGVPEEEDVDDVAAGD